MPEVHIDKLFVLLFMMTGPLRVVPGFAAITREMDAPTRNRLALRSTLFALAGVFLALFVGHTVLRSWGATPEALAAATGLLLLFTSLQALIGWPTANPNPNQLSDSTEKLALSPIAFPTILPPFAVGVLILFGAYFPSMTNQAAMFGMASALLAVDYFAMRNAHKIMATIGFNTLQVLGAVFGVLQLSLAIQMIFWSIKTALINGP